MHHDFLPVASMATALLKPSETKTELQEKTIKLGALREEIVHMEYNRVSSGILSYQFCMYVFNVVAT